MFESHVWLNATNNIGYGFKSCRIPEPRDDKITQLLRSWMALNEIDRLAASAKFSEEQRPTMLAYGERMASLAVRESNPERITLGLLALGMDGWRFDWRDNLTLILLHYDAALRVGVEPNRLFQAAASLLPPSAGNAMRQFLRRSANDKTLESMAYTAGVDADGFRYIRTW